MKFQPQHFPTGTIFELDPGESRSLGHPAGHKFEVVRVVRNGSCSYVVETTQRETIGRQETSVCINLVYIGKIVKRGAGALDILQNPHRDGMGSTFRRYQEDLSSMYRVRSKSSRSNYKIMSAELLVHYLQLKHMADGHYVFDAPRAARELLRQSFVHKDEAGFFPTHWAPKKRVDAWFKANMNRFLFSMEQAEKEERQFYHEMMQDPEDPQYDRGCRPDQLQGTASEEAGCEESLEIENVAAGC